MKSEEISFDEAIAQNAREPYVIENPINSRIFAGVLIGVAIFALIAISRVAEIGIFKRAFYSVRAASNMNKEISIPAPRGIITDRYGELLVENELTFSAFIRVSDMIKNNEKDKIIEAFRNDFGISSEDFLEKLNEADLENVEEIKVAEDVSREETIRLNAMNISSISVREDYKRKYKSAIFSHITGYVGLPRKEDLVANRKLNLIDTIGRTGLESHYNTDLQGVNGKELIYEDARGKLKDLQKVNGPRPGKDLKTTIDADLQRYFYERLTHHTNLRGQNSAVGIALDPRNGEILSLVSLPSFDANNVGEYLAISTHPLFNRAVSGTYNPGSTIKPLHAVAALHEGVIDEKVQFFSRGYIEIPNPYNPDLSSKFVDWKPHGWVDIRSALAKSSNIFFYAIAGGLPPNESWIINGASKINGLGIDRLNEYWRKFGLDKKTGIDLVGEANSFLPNPEEQEERTKQIWRIGDTYNVAIGQGDISINPIQLADYFAGIANKGKIYKPHIALRLGGEQTQESAEKPELLIDLSEFAQEFREVEKGMEDSVYEPYGTSKLISDLPFKVAAKTGTAQTNFNTRTNALFVGYGPVDAKNGPEIEIVVLIENAKEGSLNAIPVAKDVLEWYHKNRLTKDN